MPQFGGDSNHVALSGDSAGAGILTHLSAVYNGTDLPVRENFSSLFISLVITPHQCQQQKCGDRSNYPESLDHFHPHFQPEYTSSTLACGVAAVVF